MNRPTTAQDVIADIYRLNPDKPLRLAADSKGTAVAYWNETAQHWCTVAAHAITGEWVHYPYELRVNGESLIQQSDWIEVPREAITVGDGAL